MIILEMTIVKSVGVTYVVEMIVKNKIRWFGHVERGIIDFVLKRVDQMKRSRTIKQLEVKKNQ